MSNFDKKKYIESNEWLNDLYLVNPRTAAKRCKCCDGLFYTVEFTNCAEFVDNKLPVCGLCLRGNSNEFERAREVIDSLGVVSKCVVCGAERPLVDIYKDVDNTNTVIMKCKDCRKKKVKSKK